MLDLRHFLGSIDVLYSDKIKDDVKINYFSRVFGEKITDNNVEYLFKKWMSSNFKSSNLKKIQYNDETMEMVIQFQGGEFYTYFNVPFDTFMNVSEGRAVCVTSGENRYGKWEVGKTPSRGASIWKYLRDTGIKYKKGGSFK